LGLNVWITFPLERRCILDVKAKFGWLAPKKIVGTQGQRRQRINRAFVRNLPMNLMIASPA
jgi:hypothetical protein